MIEKLPHILLGIFLIFWVWSFQGTGNVFNWVLENTLTIVLMIYLIGFFRVHRFSNVSYVLIFIYMLLHLYGARYTYAETPAGFWLQNIFGWSRNNYDRVVHFCFGLLLAYPWRELFLKFVKVPKAFCWLLPAEVTLSFAAIYELVEWLVADKFFPEQGIAYLGAQGDVWDAQKDMGLAVMGAVIALVITFIFETVFARFHLLTDRIKKAVILFPARRRMV